MKLSLYKAKPTHVPADYMATCSRIHTERYKSFCSLITKENRKDMFEMKSSERWLFYFLHFSIAAAGSASGSSARVICAGERKEKTPFSMT